MDDMQMMNMDHLPEIPQEQAQQEDSQQDQQQATQSQQQVAPQENWRTLREAKERAEKERDEAIRFIKEKLQQAPQTQQQSDDELSFTLGNDDFVEGKHVKPVADVVKKTRKELHEIREQLNYYKQQAAEQRLRAECPDVDKVLTPDNIAELARRMPALAQQINNTSDLYEKGRAAFDLIRSLGIYKEDTYQPDKEIAHKNAAKPRPINSIAPQQGESALSHANAFAQGLTADLQKQLYKEMMEARKKM